MQDLVLADHAVVIADDPELDLDTHARPKGCYCQSANLSADTIADHPHLPHFAMLPLSTAASARSGIVGCRPPPWPRVSPAPRRRRHRHRRTHPTRPETSWRG